MNKEFNVMITELNRDQLNKFLWDTFSLAYMIEDDGVERFGIFKEDFSDIIEIIFDMMDEVRVQEQEKYEKS